MEDHDDQKNQVPKKRYNLRKRKVKYNETASKSNKSGKPSKMGNITNKKKKTKAQPKTKPKNKKRLKKQRDDGDEEEEDDDGSVDKYGNIKNLIDYDYSEDEEEAEEVENTLEHIINALRGNGNIRNIEFVIKEDSDDESENEFGNIIHRKLKRKKPSKTFDMLFGDSECEGSEDEENEDEESEDDSEYIPIPGDDDDEDDDEEYEENVDESDNELSELDKHPDKGEEEDTESEAEEQENNESEDEEPPKTKRSKARKSPRKKSNIQKPTIPKKKKLEDKQKHIKNIKNRFVIKQMFDLKTSEITPEILEYFETLDTKINTVPFMDEMQQFIEYSPKKQKRIIKQVKTLEKKTKKKPFKFQLLDLKVSPELKAIIYEKVAMFSTMEATSGDYYKLQSWIHSFFKLPFNKMITLPIKMSDEQSKIQGFLTEAKDKMDLELYGQTRAKDQFLQILCQWISNPNSGTNVIGLHGPPGVGKTSFIKNAVSKILKRPFGFISLGGATDSSLLDGFSYTYEGSNYGKIAEVLIKTKCMNPVIYFDELDKISGTNKGDELWNVLTHLTDATQNSHFNDKYFGGVDLDLSKALFIFSFNDIEKINKILLDRLYVIYMDGYSIKEKTEITLNYLLPKTLNKYRLEGMIKFENNKDIGYLIEAYMKRDVKGVRDLQRLLDTMISRINVQRLMGDTLDAEYKLDDLTFPLLINRDIIDKLLKDKKPERPAFMNYII
jgi:ATP-dependent Lon protease